jgi:hypothetical protein
MSYKQEVRIAVGSPTDPRSTVWKFFVKNNDIYIVSGMFENNCKISLHESGECQFSGTRTWVLAEPGRRNAERHIKKWKSPRPSSDASTHVLQIVIPDTELRVSTVPEDLSAVNWLQAPPQGNTVLFECYITKQLDADPIIGASLPFPFLFSIQLADLRWLVALYHCVPNDYKLLKILHDQIRTQAESRGIPLLPTYRMCAIGTVGETEGAFKYIELSPAA